MLTLTFNFLIIYDCTKTKVIFFILVKRYAFIFAHNAVFGRQNGRHKGEFMKRLYELRTEKGLSQRGMAANFNVSQGTYNN